MEMMVQRVMQRMKKVFTTHLILAQLECAFPQMKWGELDCIMRAYRMKMCVWYVKKKQNFFGILCKKLICLLYVFENYLVM